MQIRVDRIEINSAGAKAVLQDQGVLEALLGRGQAIANAAGGAPDYEVQGEIRSGRAHVSVRTATAAARRAEATDRTLSRALDAGR